MCCFEWELCICFRCLRAMTLQAWWVWAMYIDPVFWSINGLVATQLGDVEETMVLQNGSLTKVWHTTSETKCLMQSSGM